MLGDAGVPPTRRVIEAGTGLRPIARYDIAVDGARVSRGEEPTKSVGQTE